EASFRAHCLDANKDEKFTVSYIPKEYHYTLYYYDQAGNLVKTVPPKGVHPNYEGEFLEAVASGRFEGISVPNDDHEFLTEYRYNSLNQVVQQKSPDGGITNFWYDELGRLVISQNAQQADDGNYSYTRYDELGRI